MKEYNITVNFQDGTIDSDFMELVENDYNLTTLNFKFDTEERVVLKMLYPDKTIAYVNNITNNEYVFEPGLLSQDGEYEMEFSAYSDDGRLTNYATMSFYVRPELVNTDEIVEPDDRVPILDNLINEVDNINISATKEDDVATIIVTKKDGTTETVEVYDGEIGPQGEQGPKGDKGDTGSQGPQGIQGPKGDTGPQGIQGPKGDKGDTGSQGAVGPAGATGPQGPKGDKGDKGDTGSQGPTGPQGPKGDKGDPGLTQQEVQDLIDASIEELGELGFTPTVVQTLPTQDINIHTIYLVPKTGETGDVYDEYVYINNAWEHIGSTAVDLSNYYTKTEVDSKIKNLPFYYVAFTPTSNNNWQKFSYNLTSDDKTALSNIITDAYAKGYNTINLYVSSSNSYASPFLLTTMSNYYGNIQSKNTTIQFFSLGTEKLLSPGNGLVQLLSRILSLTVSWSNNVATVSSGYIYTVTPSLLSTDNEGSYTPTGNYNPATKKYVDDSVATKQNTLTAGSGITIENDVISTNGGSDLPIVSAAVRNYYSNSFSSDDLTNLGQAITDAKKYLDNGIGVQLLLIPTAFGYPYGGALLYLNSASSTRYEFVYRGIISSDAKTASSYTFYINGSWSGNTFTATFASFSSVNATLVSANDVLTKTNTTSYTPTANYHPATKKYVDDAISTAITDALGGSY